MNAIQRGVMAMCAMCVTVVFAQYPNTNSPLGIEVFPPADFTVDVPYIDMFQYIRGWEDHSRPAFGKDPLREQLDENGWPLYINPGQELTVGHGAGTNNHYPGGRHLLTWEGDGGFSVRSSQANYGGQGGSRFEEYDEANNRAIIFVDSTDWYWGLTLTRSTQGNHVRNVHCYMPGFWDETTMDVKAAHRNDLWHPEFIRTIERFHTLRFMGALGTNDQEKIYTWKGIKPGNWWNQGTSDHQGFRHVSPLRCIQLANRVHANAWINIPHRLDDAGVRTYAEMVRDNLNPELEVIVEYGNEHWNWAFPFSNAAAYCVNKNKEIGLPGDWGDGYHAYRSLQIWQIFDEVFAARKDKVKKALCWQTGNDFGGHFKVIDNPQWNPHGQKPDYLGIAPYALKDGIQVGIDPGTFLQRAIDERIPKERQTISRSKAAAAARGIKLAAYEANQHWHSESEAAQKYYTSLKRHPKMADFQRAYFEMLMEELNGPIIAFGTSGFGTWGGREYYNQPREESYVWGTWMDIIEDIAGPVAVAPERSGTPQVSQLKAGQMNGATAMFDLRGRLISSSTRERLANRGVKATGIMIVDTKNSGVRTMVR